MSSARSSRILWWIAFVAEVIAATIEAVQRHYLKAAGLYCLAVAFLLLALGGGSEQPRWRKIMLYVFVITSLGLLAYRFLIVKTD